MNNIYVTGATGFIGQHLIEKLLADNFKVSAAVRVRNEELSADITQEEIGDISLENDWEAKLKGADTIIHLAAQSSWNKKNYSRELLHEINVTTTEKIAHAAVKAGVKRFIFLSSIKVNGEISTTPFTETDTPNPQDPYALSKFEAETKLRKIADETGLEVVILRPSLVYGQGAVGNFQTLLKLVDLGVPLPFGAIGNKRTLCSVHNLTDFITICISHKNAANETFLVADAESYSTSELFTQLATSKGKPLFLIPLPQSFMKFMLTIVGGKTIAHRLYGSLEVDTKKAKTLLGWVGPARLNEL